MELSFFPSASGLPSCGRGGRTIHSSRDPLREARRFLASREAGEFEAPGTQVLLFGPGLSYLAELLREGRPGLDIIAVQLSPEFRGRERPGASRSWYPGGELGLEDFLQMALDPESLAPLALVEWGPGMEAFPEEAGRAREALRRVLRLRSAEAATTRGMGRLWIGNAARNFLEAEELLELSFGPEPLVILGAGPSLGPVLELLRECREGLRLVAVASALEACLARGIEPDLVVSSDPGRWNLFHLLPLRGRDLPLASPLSAAPGFRGAPLLLLDQGAAFEGPFAAALGGGLRLPSHGTVSGSALALAARLGEGPLILAGLDFAAGPAETHVRPHAFDPHILRGESRLSPGEGLRWKRLISTHPEALGGSGWRSSRALELYARAVAEDAARLGRRVYRLLPSPRLLPGPTPIEGVGLRSLAAPRLGPPERRPRGRLPAMEARRLFLAGRLRAWREEARAFLGREGAGLRPGAPIVELLRCIDLPDWAALRRAALAGLPGREAAEALAAGVEGFLDELGGRLLG